jgi:hypothetical protein
MRYDLCFASPYGIACLFWRRLWYRNASGELFEVKRHKTDEGVHWTVDSYFFFRWQDVKMYVNHGIPGKKMWELTPRDKPVMSAKTV